MPNRSEIDKATEKVRQFIHEVAVEDGMPENVQTAIETWDKPTAKALHLDAAVIDAIGLRVAEVSFWVNNEDGRGGSGCTYLQADLPDGLAVCAQTERAIIAVSQPHIFDADEELDLLKHLLVPEPRLDADLADADLADGSATLELPDAEESDTVVEFQPEAWIYGHATRVDDQGPATWTVSRDTAETIGLALASDGGVDLDFVKDDDFAPAWVANWTGPFTITVLGTKEDS